MDDGLSWQGLSGRPVELLLTQDVDRLHQAAGSERVIDPHGRPERVRCMGCERRTERAGVLDGGVAAVGGLAGV